MMRGLALRDRLAVSFASALVLAYALIALCAVIVVNRAVTSSVDGRLSTVAQAIFAIAGDEKDEIDRKDRQQFMNITADASGAFVVGPSGNPILGTIDEIPPWAHTAIEGGQTGNIFTAENDGHAVRAIVERRRTHNKTNAIIVWQSLRIVDDLERILVLVLGGFSLAVAAVGYIIGAQIAQRGLLPLTRITTVVADIAAHDLSRRVGPQPHADELGRLAGTFDRMLDRLESAFERQRRFTADASHDLRAPLATLRAEVDLALRRERTNAQYRTALAAIAADADHLDRLIDALLAAARADAADIDVRPVDLAAIAKTSVGEIAAFAQAKNVAIDARFAAPVEIVANPDLLARAILATLHNAVKFTPADASIHISVTTTANEARLLISDEGPGFSEAALSHAFDRFWRDDSARGRSGTGLGLAIAQSIVQRCGGDIAIDNAAGGGARVTITFPTTVVGRNSNARQPV